MGFMRCSGARSVRKGPVPEAVPARLARIPVVTFPRHQRPLALSPSLLCSGRRGSGDSPATERAAAPANFSRRWQAWAWAPGVRSPTPNPPGPGPEMTAYPLPSVGHVLPLSEANSDAGGCGGWVE
uniref:Uncharacterized protein n=1 Tax=Myotis myotis TaxID=51298 RepID=A0A7J8AMU4_MYOMY|nr:hypothetical protein mMyoMyo1_008069 [Myotis myotis]